jgi:hypothetical protein
MSPGSVLEEVEVEATLASRRDWLGPDSPEQSPKMPHRPRC